MLLLHCLNVDRVDYSKLDSEGYAMYNVNQYTPDMNIGFTFCTMSNLVSYRVHIHHIHIFIHASLRVRGLLMQLMYNISLFLQDVFEMSKECIHQGQRVVIMDDLIATGGQ